MGDLTDDVVFCSQVLDALTRNANVEDLDVTGCAISAVHLWGIPSLWLGALRCLRAAKTGFASDEGIEFLAAVDRPWASSLARSLVRLLSFSFRVLFNHLFNLLFNLLFNHRRRWSSGRRT